MGWFSSDDEDNKVKKAREAAEKIGKKIPIAGKAVSTVAERRRKQEEAIRRELGLKKGGVVNGAYAKKLKMAKGCHKGNK